MGSDLVNSDEIEAKPYQDRDRLLKGLNSIKKQTPLKDRMSQFT